MSELIIKAVDGKNIDPIIEAQDCYRTNDVISIFDDNHPWTALESKVRWIAEGNLTAWHGKTYLIKLPGVPKEKVLALMDEDQVKFVRRARRLWKFDINVIPVTDKNVIDDTGEVSMVKPGATLNGYFKNKITDAEYTGI